MLRNLALLLVSTLLTVGALEVSIRAGWVPFPDFFESSGWWREHWIRKRRGPVPMKFVALDPDLGWVPAPGLDRLPYQGAQLSTNRASIRGRRDHAPGPSQRIRIVAIGDSFMFGQCLEDAETIPAVLESLLPGSEVINLGVMGYGPGQMLERLTRDGRPYEPDIVLLGFFEPDAPRARLAFRDYAKPRYVLHDDGRLELTQVPIGEPEAYEGGLRSLNFAGMLRDSLSTEALEEEEDALGRALVAEMARVSEAAAARFAVVYFPTRDQVDAGDPLPTPYLAELCREQGWVCSDPTAAILEAYPKRRRRKAHFKCHYSAQVARIIATETAEALRERYPDLFNPPG